MAEHFGMEVTVCSVVGSLEVQLLMDDGGRNLYYTTLSKQFFCFILQVVDLFLEVTQETVNSLVSLWRILPLLGSS